MLLLTGSELERTDIKKAYLNGKGCINYMMNCVPFMSVEDEPRIQEIVKSKNGGFIQQTNCQLYTFPEMIDAKEVPEYKIFTKEPKDKTKRRHKKYARETLEAEAIKKKMSKKGPAESLEQQILKRQQERASEMGSLFDKLLEKYAGDDDTEEFTIDEFCKRKGKKKTTAKKAERTEKIENRKVRSGRISKKK